MPLRFVTTKAKVRWDKVALDVVVGALFGDVVSNNYSGKARVVAVNDAGQGHVVGVDDPERGAEDQMAVIETDYEAMSTQQWCEKYGVPLPFAEG